MMGKRKKSRRVKKVLKRDPYNLPETSLTSLEFNQLETSFLDLDGNQLICGHAFRSLNGSRYTRLFYVHPSGQSKIGLMGYKEFVNFNGKLNLNSGLNTILVDINIKPGTEATSWAIYMDLIKKHNIHVYYDDLNINTACIAVVGNPLSSKANHA